MAQPNQHTKVSTGIGSLSINTSGGSGGSIERSSPARSTSSRCSPSRSPSPARSPKVLWSKALANAGSLADSDPWAKYKIEENPAELILTKKLRLKEIEVEKDGLIPHDDYEISWEETQAVAKIHDKKFAEGAMRECYRLKKLPQQPNSHFHALDWKHANNYVAKRYKKNDTDDSIYENDIKLQMEAAYWAKLYNQCDPPKKIDMINAYLIQFIEREGAPIFCVERFIEGEYIKHNTNAGFVDHDDHRMTPQAFSHFSYHKSGGRIMVVDIQGVGDLYTDPQIHSLAQTFGDGDLGDRGMALFFGSHRCSSLCAALGLRPFALAPREAWLLDRAEARAPPSETFVSDSSRSLPGTASSSSGPLPSPMHLALSPCQERGQRPEMPPPPPGSSDSLLLNAESLSAIASEDLEPPPPGGGLPPGALDVAAPGAPPGGGGTEEEDPERFGPVHLALARARLADPAAQGPEDAAAVLWHLAQAARRGRPEALTFLARLRGGEASGDALLPAAAGDPASFLDPGAAAALWARAAAAGSVPAACRVLSSLGKGREDVEKSIELYKMLLEAADKDPEVFDDESTLRPYQIKANLAEIYSLEGLDEGACRDLHDGGRAAALYNEAAELAMGEMKMKLANGYLVKAELCG